MDRYAGRVAALAVLACLLITGTTVLLLIAGRSDDIARAQLNSANVSSAIARDIARNLEVSDLSLQAVVQGVQDPKVMQLPGDLRRRVLFGPSATAQFISGIYAVNEEGKVDESRSDLPLSRLVDLSDRDYFSVHRANAKVGLFLSQPLASRLRAGAPSIALSRRISHADGTFGGIALIVIKLDYFQQMVDGVKLGPHGAATIVQTDGSVVARNPRMSGEDSFVVTNSSTFHGLLAADSGSYRTVSPIDGVEKIMTFSRVSGSNLIVVVAPALAEVTQQWRNRSLMIGTLVIAISAAFTTVVWLLVHAVRQRDSAQAKLLQIAETDALTAVANRRRLDMALPELWSTATRDNAPVSLLFIDADNFKIFNDTHGHEVGDRALKFVAQCLKKYMQNPLDIAARYGGEEFVVGLYDCDERSAWVFAESVRLEIANATQRQSQPDVPAFTISIGLVACEPALGDDMQGAMRHADEALYESKAAGRNRVTVFHLPDHLRLTPSI